MKKFLLSISIAIITLLLTQAVYAEQNNTIDVYDLWKAVQEDRTAAINLYKGQEIKVEGIVLYTGVSVYLTPNVALSNVEQGTEYVKCVLPRLDMDKLNDFQFGQKVKMTGVFYRVSDYGIIIMKQCRITN